MVSWYMVSWYHDIECRGERDNLAHVLNRTAAVTGLGDNEVWGEYGNVVIVNFYM